MSEQLEPWADRMAKGLAELPKATQATLAPRAQMVLESLRRASPKGANSSVGRSWSIRRNGDAYSVASNHPAAQQLDRGGTVSGRPWLAVPIKPGVGTHGEGPRNDGTLVPITTRDGRRFLASRAGASIDIRWRLVRNVTTPARPYLRDALHRALQTWAHELRDVTTSKVGPRG